VGIPDDGRIIELLAIGYPADYSKEHGREPIEKIVSFERWNF